MLLFSGLHELQEVPSELLFGNTSTWLCSPQAISFFFSPTQTRTGVSAPGSSPRATEWASTSPEGAALAGGTEVWSVRSGPNSRWLMKGIGNRLSKHLHFSKHVYGPKIEEASRLTPATSGSFFSMPSSCLASKYPGSVRSIWQGCGKETN